MDTSNSDSRRPPRSWDDRYWESPDGLKLYFRNYVPSEGAGSNSLPPIICMHGLTRNSRDFAGLADRLSKKWRVLVPEMRGRGLSEYAKDTVTYNPLTYVADVEALLEQEGIDKFIAIGTSLGGLMTMLLAAKNPARISGAILNDIGPEVDPKGIDRIREYVGHGRSYPSWIHAARALQEVHSSSYPDFELEEWLDAAKRGMVVQQNGRIAYDYDMGIAEPFQDTDGAAPPDLWPALDALNGKPVLIVRGELSDLLSVETLTKMQNRLANASTAIVPNVGHAPMLDEPIATRAIDAFLERVA